MTDAPDDALTAPPEATHLPPPRHTPLWAALSRLLERLESWLRSHGGTRLRRGIQIFWAAVTAIGILLLVGPVINAPLTFDDITSSAGDATSTWIAKDFSADYTLARGNEGELVVTVRESFTAVFPDDVDEDAIERVVATQYEGHDLAPRLVGARLDGRPIDPRVTTGPTRTTYTIDAGGRFTGSHPVELTYVLTDVAYDDRDLSSDLPYQVLQWDVFGPEWPHGVSGSALRVNVPRDLADAFARQPTSGIAWLLVSGSVTMEPEDAASEPLVYEVDNDQNIPPHGSFWFTMRFAPGTFAMPGPSPLFFVQAYGPFVPLLLLAAGVLFALAARTVAWGDARGRAWFVPESSPRRGSSLALDARLWGARRTAAIAEALEEWRRSPTDPRLTRRLARAGYRAGRWGDLIPSWRAFRFSPAWRKQFDDGLRRVPSGFVRDAFLGGAVALTALQLGLARQLSHQRALTLEWWPPVAAALAVVLAIAVFAIALSARPLTRAGALAREHLLGQRLHLRTTLAAERTPLRSADLPYVLLFERPRAAGRLVRRLLAREGIGRRAGADPAFFGPGRLSVRALALAVVAGAVALAFLTPAATSHAPDQDDVLEGVSGDYGVGVTDADIEAALTRGDDGAARLEVVERLRATVIGNLRAVPQVTRAWRDVVDGHDQGLRVEAIAIDGEDVPFVQSRRLDHAVVQTRLPDDWAGEHDVEVRYALERPVVAADGPVDQLTWTALMPWWSSSWELVDVDTERLRVALTLSDELADRLVDGSGWLDQSPYRPSAPPVPLGESLQRGADTVIAFDERSDEEFERNSLWPSSSQFAGLELRFAADTFAASPPPGIGHRLWTALPWVIGPLLAVLAIVLGLIGAPAGSRVGLRRDIARWLPLSLTVAQVFLVGWASGEATDEDPIVPVVLVPLGLSIVVVIIAFVATRRPKPGKGRPPTASSPPPSTARPGRKKRRRAIDTRA
ncbi:hypothetical protein Q9R20_08855 [Microbacterium sp. PRF11]|uniref:hypothetical protein n=1 Tax=Microbacterium sp. PRF11 TaxID=2962593 RepID=UPI002880F8C6|nr:hypothetical protein [Microbacterium sp. PRF11]MDT0117101.1 hypothetical protein [Microbacterium sp. PRF11]